MADYYDREGEPITVDEWMELFGDMDYRLIGSDVVNGYLISTVWLGMDHQFGYGLPLIFETMVFTTGESGDVNYGDLDVERYSTVEEAEAGHARMIAEWSSR